MFLAKRLPGFRLCAAFVSAVLPPVPLGTVKAAVNAAPVVVPLVMPNCRFKRRANSGHHLFVFMLGHGCCLPLNLALGPMRFAAFHAAAHMLASGA